MKKKNPGKLFFILLLLTAIHFWEAILWLDLSSFSQKLDSPILAFANAKKFNLKYSRKKRLARKKEKYVKAILPNSLPDDLIPAVDFQFLLYKNLLEKSKRNLEVISSIRGTLIKEERIKGKLLPFEEIEFVASKDFLFMQWQKGENYQRKLLYRPAMDPGQIWLLQPKGIWRKLNAFQIQSQSKPLYSGNRHLIPNKLEQGIWFNQILDFSIREIALGRSEPEFKLSPVQLDFINEHQCYLLKSMAPEEWVKENEDYLPVKENEFYAYRAELWLEKNTLLPLKIAIYGKGWKKEGILLESYNFRNIEINPELKIDEFLPQRLFTTKSP
jgi:hypothetical protein